VARQLLMHGGIFDRRRACASAWSTRSSSEALDATVAALAEELKLGAPSVQAWSRGWSRDRRPAARCRAADILGGTSPTSA
jgi:hypothetical protein